MNAVRVLGWVLAVGVALYFFVVYTAIFISRKMSEKRERETKNEFMNQMQIWKYMSYDKKSLLLNKYGPCRLMGLWDFENIFYCNIEKRNVRQPFYTVADKDLILSRLTKTSDSLDVLLYHKERFQAEERLRAMGEIFKVEREWLLLVESYNGLKPGAASRYNDKGCVDCGDKEHPGMVTLHRLTGTPSSNEFSHRYYSERLQLRGDTGKGEHLPPWTNYKDMPFFCSRCEERRLTMHIEEINRKAREESEAIVRRKMAYHSSSHSGPSCNHVFRTGYNKHNFICEKCGMFKDYYNSPRPEVVTVSSNQPMTVPSEWR